MNDPGDEIPRAAPKYHLEPGLTAIYPGLLLAIVGGLVLVDRNAPHEFGVVLLVLGQGLFLVGAIAKGLAWGLAQHAAGLASTSTRAASDQSS